MGDTHPGRFYQVILALGFGLRFIEYLRHESLWDDEAMLALNIASRPFHELLPPLGYGQVAPVPFLWTERLMVVLFGVNEWALRAIPLLAGSALCVVVYLIARRMVRSEEALVAAIFAACSLPLIRYSAQVKPYVWDALVAISLVGAAELLLQRVDNRRSWLIVTAAGGLAILLSFPAVFVCLGVGLALLAQALNERKLQVFPRLFVMAATWATLYTVIYRQLYDRAASTPYMQYFWEAAFLTPDSPQLLARGKIAVTEVLWGIDPGMAWVGLGMLTAALLALGITGLCRRGQVPCAILLLVPALAPFAASVLGWYPIALRLMLFALPLLIIVAAVGVITSGRFVHHLVPRVPIRWVAAMLLIPGVTLALALAVRQTRNQQLRPLVRYLAERWRPGEAVYVFHRIAPAWLFYSTDWSTPDLSSLAWAMEVSGPGGLGHENGPSRGPRRSCEGSELKYELRGHRVLLGTSSGIHYRVLLGRRPPNPDPGWAESEARRVQGAARARVWLVLRNDLSRFTDEETLLRSVVRRGGTLVYQSGVEGHSDDASSSPPIMIGPSGWPTDMGQDPRLYLFEFPAGESEC